MSAGPEDARFIEERFARAARARSTLWLEDLALGLVEIGGATAVETIRREYGEGSARTGAERTAVARALAIHASDGEASLRPFLAAALRDVLAGDTIVAPIVASAAAALSTEDRVAIAGDLSALLARGRIDGEAERFAVVSFLMLERMAFGRDAPEPVLLAVGATDDIDETYDRGQSVPSMTSRASGPVPDAVAVVAGIAIVSILCLLFTTLGRRHLSPAGIISAAPREKQRERLPRVGEAVLHPVVLDRASRQTSPSTGAVRRRILSQG